MAFVDTSIPNVNAPGTTALHNISSFNDMISGLQSNMRFLGVYKSDEELFYEMDKGGYNIFNGDYYINRDTNEMYMYAGGKEFLKVSPSTFYNFPDKIFDKKKELLEEKRKIMKKILISNLNKDKTWDDTVFIESFYNRIDDIDKEIGSIDSDYEANSCEREDLLSYYFNANINYQ